jgi:predicted dithiol-disulfide oxidoreductase (DUF899 family)
MPEPLGTSHRLPQIADRQTSQAKIDELRVKEKAHTRAGDALAAERRRLPMVEVDPTTTLIGADGPVSLIDIFDGRSQLIAYFDMWHAGRPAAEQCEGCTFSTTHINELSYLNSRDVGYATFCQDPLLDLTIYAWPESWEDSPEGWPQRWGSKDGRFQLDACPAAQWSRIKAGRNDDLGTAPGDQSEQHSH